MHVVSYAFLWHVNKIHKEIKLTNEILFFTLVSSLRQSISSEAAIHIQALINSPCPFMFVSYVIINS